MLPPVLFCLCSVWPAPRAPLAICRYASHYLLASASVESALIYRDSPPTMASLCLDPFDLVDIQLLASWSRWCILNHKLLQLLGDPPDFHNSAPHLSSRSTIVECHSARCDDIGPGAPSIIRSLLSLRATLPLCCPVLTLTFRFCCSNLASSVVSLFR